MPTRLRGFFLLAAVVLLPVATVLGGLVDTFDPPNTAVTAQQGGSAPGPAVVGGGPTAQFLRLVNNNVNGQCNHYAYDLSDPGSFATTTIDFDIRLSGGSNPADGMAFMLLPTTTYGTTGVGPGGYYHAEEPNFAGIFGIGVDVYPAGAGVNDVSVHWNGAEVENVRLDPAQVDLDSGAFHHIHARLDHRGPGSNVLLQITNDINGSASPTVTAIDRFVYGMLPFENRVQLSARTGGMNMDVDVDNVNVQYSTPCIVQDFDSPGTSPFTTTQYGSSPGPLVVSGGPTGNFLRVVNDDVNGQLGVVAFDRGSLVGPFPWLRIAFDFRMGGQGDGADGLGFAFLNTANYGTSGAAPGFGEEPNLAGSFGLGLDIFDNGAADVSQDSISLHWNGSKVAEADLTGLMDLENNVFNHLEALVVPTAGGSNVTVVITPDALGATPGSPLTVFNNYFIAGLSRYEGRLAFSGRTGGLNANHDIDNVVAQFVPEPGSCLLFGGGLLALLGRRRRRK